MIWHLTLMACVAEPESSSSTGSPQFKPASDAPEGAVPQVEESTVSEFADPVDEPGSPPSTDSLPDAALRTVPLMGGTVAVSGDLAWVTDPLLDLIVIIDLELGLVVSTPDLHPGDIPFRTAVVGTTGYTTLRGPGGLAISDPNSGWGEAARLPIGCPEPRGITADGEELLVACASGEIVTLDLAGNVMSTTFVAHDIRDIVVMDEHVFVSRMKSAEILVLDRWTLAETSRTAPQAPAEADQSPTVAVRMVAIDGGVMVLHQSAKNPTELISFDDDEQLEYGDPEDPCNDMLSARLTRVTLDANDLAKAVTSPALGDVVVPGDLIVDGGTVQVAVSGAPAGGHNGTPSFTNIFGEDDDDCITPTTLPITTGRVVAIGLNDAHSVVVSANPTTVEVDGELVAAFTAPSNPSVEVFHGSTEAGIACASCHPEGLEDGHVWAVAVTGVRRTQSLAGNLLSRMPFHWSGDQADFGVLMADVFQDRMLGSLPSEAGVDALASWLDGLEPVRVTSVTGDVARGAAVFTESGCDSCHSGENYTDNSVVDVGTGEPLKVPHLLGIGYRAPFMHDGRAADLVARFTDPDCAIAEHGAVAPDDVVDLVAWLETL